MTRTSQRPKAHRPIRLSNGVRVLCVRTAHNKARGSRGAGGPCSVQFWIAGGTAHERAHEHGAAHFTEHMVFRPWGEGEGEDLATWIESRGGEVNAYTAHDETVYYTKVGAQQVLGALEGLRHAVFEPDFAVEAVDREREVILEEIEQYADEPNALVADANALRMYPAHAYGRPILGEASGLRALSASALKNFHRRVYVGHALTVVVVGPVPRAKVHAWAKRALGGLAPGKPLALPKRWPRTPEAGVEVLAVPGVDAQLRVGWAGPGITDKDAVALDLLSVILGQGDSSRMAAILRREQGLALDTHAAFVGGARAGSFVLVASSAAESAEACTAALLQLRAELDTRPPSEAEIEAARRMLQTSLVYRRETVSGQAHALGFYETVGGSNGEGSELEAQYFAQLALLDTKELARVARDYLPLSRVQVSLGMPLPAATDHGLDARKRRSLAKRIQTQLARAQGSQGRTSKVAGPSWSRAAGLWRCELEGGLRLVIAPDPSLPIAAACLAWRGGQSVELESEAGLGQLLARCVARGDEARTSLGVARWLDARAASLDGFFGRSASGIAFEATRPDFDELLDMAFTAGINPRLDAIDLRRERELLLEELSAEAQDAASACVSQALRALYGQGHPYARPLRGRAKVLRGATRAQLLAQWRRRGLASATLGVAGDVDPGELAAQVQTLLRAWPAGTKRSIAPKAFTARPLATRTLRRSAKRPDLNQSQITVAFAVVPEGHPDAPALEVAAEILGSQTGPLFAALREREGLVYGVNVGLTSTHDAGHLLVHAAASGDNFVRARAVTLDTLKQFAGEGPDMASFERGRATLVGHLERAWQRRASIAAAITMYTLRGEDPAKAWTWSTRVAAVRLDEVRAVAKRYLSRPGVVSVVQPAKLRT